jgi:hypothetical protein
MNLYFCLGNSPSVSRYFGYCFVKKWNSNSDRYFVGDGCEIFGDLAIDNASLKAVNASTP